jgi:hypothetical protein
MKMNHSDGWTSIESHYIKDVDNKGIEGRGEKER